MKHALAAIGLAVSAPAFAACSYPLDATATELAGVPFLAGWQLPATVNGQSIAFSVAPNPGSLARYTAFTGEGAAALASAYASGLPGGDIDLAQYGNSGLATVQVQVDSFPFQTLAAPGETVALVLTLNSGNLQPGSSDVFNYTVSIVNSSSTTQPRYVSVIGQSISNGTVAGINRNFGFSLPLPVTAIGLGIDLATRQLSLVADGAALGTLTDADNQPLVVPAGVNRFAVGLGGLHFNIATDEPQVGASVAGTLLTDLCATGSAGTGLRLPNGKAFPGKAAPRGLQKFQALSLPAEGPLGQLLKP